MICPVLWPYCVSLRLAGTLLTSWELPASPGLGWSGGLTYYSPLFSNAGNIHSTNTGTNNTPSSHRLDLHMKEPASSLLQPGAHRGVQSPGPFISQRWWRNSAGRERRMRSRACHPGQPGVNDTDKAQEGSERGGGKGSDKEGRTR